MTRTTVTSPRRTTRPLTAALAGALFLGLLTTACGQQGRTAGSSGVVSRTESVASTGATPYVVNHYGEENTDAGRAERSPKTLVLSEFTTISDVTWQEWGAERAVGTGGVTGTWCLDACVDQPLKATVTLSDPTSVDGKEVFSAFRLSLTVKAGAYDSEDLRGKRPLVTH
ncbi:hypothetical protein [Streptomyces sp. NPDC059176]|uniref:hypothetical protein n=1 Tax=unclassified Streptomyces TaxID=2593676 RepID=UPI0036AD8FF9